ncbi:MAG: CNNM domain-containing protein, partial [Acutalibacteraceae bacterium]
MDGHSIGLIISMAVLVVFSGFFSASETAFSSLNRIRVKNLADQGSKAAKRVLKLCENYDRLLSTVLVGNNIVNITLTAISTVFFVNVLKLSAGATISTVVITVVVLIFGEVSPKSIAKDHAEGYAMATAPLISFLCVIFTPINFLFTLWKKLLSKIFKISEESGMTEDELLTIVDEAQQGGSLDADESELIRSAIEFDEREVVEIFTPRVDIEGVECGAKK